MEQVTEQVKKFSTFTWFFFWVCGGALVLTIVDGFKHSSDLVPLLWFDLAIWGGTFVWAMLEVGIAPARKARADRKAAENMEKYYAVFRERFHKNFAYPDGSLLMELPKDRQTFKTDMAYYATEYALRVNEVISEQQLALTNACDAKERAEKYFRQHPEEKLEKRDAEIKAATDCVCQREVELKISWGLACEGGIPIELTSR